MPSYFVLLHTHVESLFWNVLARRKAPTFLGHPKSPGAKKGLAQPFLRSQKRRLPRLNERWAVPIILKKGALREGLSLHGRGGRFKSFPKREQLGEVRSTWRRLPTHNKA